MMNTQRMLVLGFSLVLVAAAGCATKFTRENFDMIRVDVDRQEDVLRILGEPYARFGDEWTYDDLDRHVSARVFFHEDGRVAAKEWMDAARGTWEGQDPKADAPPRGELREEHQTRRVYED